MTELEKMIHEAVEKAFKDYLEMQGKARVFSITPQTLERNAKYEELWNRAIVAALESMDKKVEQ